MKQSRLDMDRNVFNRLLTLRAIENRTDAEQEELRQLTVIYYVSHSDIRNYWVPYGKYGVS